MPSEQYKDIGTVTVTNASQIIIGASTDFSGQLSLPCIFKVNRDGESTYSVGTISTATRVILAANYLGSTDSGLDYIFCRSFTTNRGYWRPLQGDADFAEILSQETIDEIDEDIAHIMSGNASVEGTISDSFGIDTDSNCGRFKVTNLSSSRELELPDVAANIVAMDTSFTASALATASIVGTASFSGQCTGFKKLYTVLGTPFAIPYWDIS